MSGGRGRKENQDGKICGKELGEGYSGFFGS